MAKKNAVPKDVSVIITNGKKRFVKKGEQDELVQFPGGRKHLDGGTPSDENLTDAQKTENGLIEAILSNEIYTKHLQGVERTDAILQELYELKIISEEQLSKYKGEELKLNTLKQVQKLIETKE